MKEIKPPQLPKSSSKKRTVLIIALILAITYKLWIDIVIMIGLLFWGFFLMFCFLVGSILKDLGIL
jgi:hypothetical protein